jgi:hypothetical protein
MSSNSLSACVLILWNISICGISHRSVLSTEASHSFIVRGAVEKPASLPKPAAPVEQQIPPLRCAPVGMTPLKKDTLKIERIFQDQFDDTP